MTPDERELRRALDARSGAPSPDFGARLGKALSAGQQHTNLMPAVAAFVVAVLTVATVGVLVYTRNSRPPSHVGPASASRTTSPAPSPPGPYYPTTTQLSAPSHDVVWAFVAGTFLYVSTDRGDTWAQRTLPAVGGGGPLEVSFVDANQGWLSVPGIPETQCNAAGIAIWHTSDGARTWERLTTTGIADRQCKQGLSFTDARHGFISGWDDNNPPVVYRTADGGLTWKASAPIPDPPGFKTSGGGDALRVHQVWGSGGAYLMTAYGTQPTGGRAYVFRSGDGGATWTYAADVPNPAVSVAFITASRWLQVGAPGQSVETTDGGKSWHAYASDYSQAAPIAPEVVFGDAMVGYATVRGAIQRTVDGGLHWTPIQAPGT